MPTPRGRPQTPATRAKIAAAKKRYYSDPQHRAHVLPLAQKASSVFKGRQLPPEHRAKMSLAARRYWADPAHDAEIIARRKKIAASKKGRPLAPETIAKMVASRRGRPLSTEHRANISAALRGKQFTLERKRKMSEVRKGKPLSLYQRQRMSEVRKGKPLSPEHAAAVTRHLKGIAEARKGKPVPEETRRKISESLRRRKERLRAARQAKRSASMRARWQDPTYRQIVTSHLRELADKRRGKKLSPEHRKKIGIAHKGRTLSLEHRLKIGQAKKGKAKSLDERQMLSDFMKQKYARIRQQLLADMRRKGLIPAIEYRAEKGQRRIIATERTPAAEAIELERSRIIDAAIRRLPELETRVITEIYFEGKTIDELARELNERPDAINSILEGTLRLLSQDTELGKLK